VAVLGVLLAAIILPSASVPAPAFFDTLTAAYNGNHVSALALGTYNSLSFVTDSIGRTLSALYLGIQPSSFTSNFQNTTLYLYINLNTPCSSTSGYLTTLTPALYTGSMAYAPAGTQFISLLPTSNVILLPNREYFITLSPANSANANYIWITGTNCGINQTNAQYCSSGAWTSDGFCTAIMATGWAITPPAGPPAPCGIFGSTNPLAIVSDTGLAALPRTPVIAPSTFCYPTILSAHLFGIQ